ncbi:hypothetical protein BKA70DRAFT_1444259 [Coprinopsis sp. MPI-PUGE-AT-0042]|nr:hypothetical protein BKA70DRAFT_1444259 [Coprinopsis sp. MPI-PUGE-AT-0042]
MALALTVHRLSLPSIYERPAFALLRPLDQAVITSLQQWPPLLEFPDPPPLHATNRFIGRLEGVDKSTSRFSINSEAEQHWSSHDEPDIGQMKSGERMAYAIRALSSLLLGTRQGMFYPHSSP